MARRLPPRPPEGRKRRSGVSPRDHAPPSEAILDTAFRRGHRVSAHGVGRVDRGRRAARLHIVRSFAVVLRHLGAIERASREPPLTELDQKLIADRFPAGMGARSLRRLRVAQDRIRRLLQEDERRLGRLQTIEDFGILVRNAYGRLASYLREVDSDIENLRAIQRFRADRPRIDPSLATVVVAGFPNVGKSSLVARLSSARPKVAPWPFTTQALVVGHADLGFDRLQVLDTPGVLGRAHRANPAEREALVAVHTGATLILFVLDPTGGSGYTLEDQERLLARWREELPQVPLLEVETKSDLLKTGSGRLAVSAKTGAGLEQLDRRLRAELARVQTPTPGVAP